MSVVDWFKSVPKDGLEKTMQDMRSVEQQRNEAIAKKHNVEVLATYNTGTIKLDTEDKL